MKINFDYPKPLDLKRNERKTLDYLRNQPNVQQDFGELASRARNTYYQISDDKSLKLSPIDFNAEMAIEIERRKKKVFVGAIIKTHKKKNRYEYQLVSYLLAICNGSELIRKFHFDYAFEKVGQNQSVPIFHLQYGGKLSPYMKQKGIDDGKIEPWLSSPRLNFPPITLALLLDVVFSEFRTVETNRIVEDPQWRSLVKRNEELVMIPYFSNILRFTNSGLHRQNRLVRDFCHGN